MKELLYLALLELPGTWLKSASRMLEYASTDALAVPQLANAIRNVLVHNPPKTALAESDIEKAVDNATRHWEHMLNTGMKLLFRGHPEYPPLLAKIKNSPAALFVRGNSQALTSAKTLAIVGTREPSRYGELCTKKIAETLAGSSWCIVSGLALGIDAAAHQGALDAKGLTVAVLAHGLDRVYPKSNTALAEEILASNGALVSEYPPGSPPHRGQFVDRDRLQSGLALGTLIIESDINGGAMHTARFAKEQGRHVFALLNPRKPNAEKSRGPSHLVRTGQAEAVEDKSVYNRLGEIAKLSYTEPVGPPTLF